MKNLFFIPLIILSFWSCNSGKETTYKKFDDSRTKFKTQEGFCIPTLSQDKLIFTENKDFKEFSKKFKKSASLSIYNDTCVDIYTNSKGKFYKERYCFYDGFLSTVIKVDSIKADWKDKKNKNVYFQYQTQIGYHKNGAIEYYVNWLIGNKLHSSQFQVGTKYYFDENGKLIDSLDLSKLYKSSLKSIYKKLYDLNEPYDYENIENIYRYFDNKNSMWLISYYGQKGNLIIDDKTLKIYSVKNIDEGI